jgi:hypothetical protein
MKKLSVIAKWFFIIWGVFSFFGVLIIGGLFAYQFTIGNRDKINTASTKDVRFIFNWSNLGEDRIEKVINSHISSRSFTGDHVDAYAIRVKHISIEELTAKKDHQWYRADQLPKVPGDAVSFVGPWLHEIPWFLGEAELRSSEIYVYLCSIHYYGINPSAAEIIFVRPKDKMVFFFSGKT